MAQARSCEDCFFRQRSLCALPRTEPCATFRPAVDGRLAPPIQAPLLPAPTLMAPAPVDGAAVITSAL